MANRKANPATGHFDREGMPDAITQIMPPGGWSIRYRCEGVDGRQEIITQPLIAWGVTDGGSVVGLIEQGFRGLYSVSCEAFVGYVPPVGVEGFTAEPALPRPAASGAVAAT